MGDTPEAIEGQAKLFRVLTAYARYNPQIGYSQGDGLEPSLAFMYSTVCHSCLFLVYENVICKVLLAVKIYMLTSVGLSSHESFI